MCGAPLTRCPRSARRRDPTARDPGPCVHSDPALTHCPASAFRSPDMTAHRDQLPPRGPTPPVPPARRPPSARPEAPYSLARLRRVGAPSRIRTSPVEGVGAAFRRPYPLSLQV